MLNSIDQNTINMVLDNAKSKETQKTQQTSNAIKVEDNAMGTTAAAPNVDELELSTDAQTYLDAVNAETQTADSSSSAEATGEGTSAAIDELYTYTESELAELLANGDITQREYDEEIARRGG